MKKKDWIKVDSLDEEPSSQHQSPIPPNGPSAPTVPTAPPVPFAPGYKEGKPLPTRPTRTRQKSEPFGGYKPLIPTERLPRGAEGGYDRRESAGSTSVISIEPGVPFTSLKITDDTGQLPTHHESEPNQAINVLYDPAMGGNSTLVRIQKKALLRSMSIPYNPRECEQIRDSQKIREDVKAELATVFVGGSSQPQPGTLRSPQKSHVASGSNNSNSPTKINALKPDQPTSPKPRSSSEALNTSKNNAIQTLPSNNPLSPASSDSSNISEKHNALKCGVPCIGANDNQSRGITLTELLQRKNTLTKTSRKVDL